MKSIKAFSNTICIVIALLIITNSCNYNKQKKLIESFVCTTNGVFSDLNFKVIKLEETTPITAFDSMIYYVYEKMPLKYTAVGDSFNITFMNDKGMQYDTVFRKSRIDTSLMVCNKFKELFSSFINRNDSLINDLQKEREENYYLDIYYKDWINRYIEENNINTETIAKFEIEIQNLEKAKKYSLMPLATILARSFDCAYSILNPILKVKQTQTRTFYFDQELNRILASSDIKE